MSSIGQVAPDRAPEGFRSGRALARTAIGWGVALALLAWLLRVVRWTEVGEVLALAPPWAWPLAAAGICASHVLRGLRIHAELSRRHRVTRWACLRLTLLHNAAVNLVPLRGGEAAYPLLAQRLGVPFGRALASLVWIRAQDALLLALFAVALLPGLSPWVKATLAAAGLGAVLLAIAALRRALARSGAATPRSSPAGAAVAALSALTEAPRHGVSGWLYGAGSWAVKLGAITFLLSALAGLPAAGAGAGAVAGELAAVLPLQGPAGFGTYEAGVWAGTAVRGGAGLAVAAPAVVVHLFALAVALAAAAVAWIGGGALRADRVPFAPALPAESPRA